MKIHKQPKKVGVVHPEVTALISRVLSTPSQDLPAVLATVQTWNYPRCDLHSWSAVLNRFDELLEQVIKDYEVDKLQVNDFAPSAKGLVSEILRFERLLLDNSTNRKIYASYDRLNALLFTTDLDILILTLRLFLRPAQQYSSQASLSQSLAISTPRLATLCMRFPTLRDHDLELAALVSTSDPPSPADLPPGDVHFSFYRLEGSKTPGPVGLNAINLPGLAKDPRPTADIVAAVIDKYGLPDEERFELLHRVRLARAFGCKPEDTEDREKLAVVRLLTVAIFCHTHAESNAQNLLFLPDPMLLTTVAECVSSSVPPSVQTAALAALDGLARYRGKLQEVMAAVNAGVSHGILMSAVRRVVAELEKAEESKELGGLGLDGVEQLMGFVTYLASNAQGGNMIVGAGLIPLLVQIIENKRPAVLAVLPKTMALVDNVLYGYTNAFTIWLNSRGVDVLVQRIKDEVEYDIEATKSSGEGDDTPGPQYGRLPYIRSTALKNFLRSMHRMMQSSGTAEGLRNLIDSSLSKSVKLIMEHRGLFGPHIFGLSINIMATFVHNEPTSLTILQEQHLPETFYNSIELGIEPAIEVIQAIPNAIGALCLNQAGQDMLTSRPTVIPGLFSVFTSEKHSKTLQDRENAAALGTAVDELIRHHPVLKGAVMDAVKGVFDKIDEIAKGLEERDDWAGIYRLKAVSDSEAKGKGKQGEETDGLSDPMQVDSQPRDALEDFIVEGNEGGRPTHDFGENPIMAYIDVLIRFLEGLFQHAPHCREFMNRVDGVARIGNLYTLPCLPYDFTSSPAAEAIIGVLRVMCEVGPSGTLAKINDQMRDSLRATAEFWSSMDVKPKLEPLATLSDLSDLAEANKLFRSLIILLGRVTLMAEVYASISYSHGRAATTFLQTLNSIDDPKFIEDLCALHRTCIWENILLKAVWPKVKQSSSGSSTSPDPPSAAPASPPAVESPSSSPTPGDRPSSSTPLEVKDNEEAKAAPSAKETPLEQNIKAIRHLVGQIPMSLTIFFQAIVKMFLYSRRNVDPAQKRQATATASLVAKSLVKHLQWRAEAPADKSAPQAYGTVMLGLITILFFDERTSQNNLQTMLLVHFREAGGLQAIFDMCRSWSATASNLLLADGQTADDRRALIHTFGGLKVALNLLEALVSAKPLIESGQTALLTTKDKKPGDKDYFEAHDFLIRLRLDILPLISELWEAPWITVNNPGSEGLSSPPLSVIKSVIHIMQHIMDGQGEERKAETAAHGMGLAGLPAFAAGGGLLGGAPRPPFVLDEARVQQIIDMGFPRHAAERALSRTANHVAAAAEYLLTHPLALMPEPAPMPPPPAPPAPPAPLAPPVNANEAPDVVMDAPAVGAGEALPAANAGEPVPSAGPSEEAQPEAQKVVAPLSQVQPTADVKKELDVQRRALEKRFPTRSLLIVDAHESLIFDVKGAFISSKEGYSRSAFEAITDDIKAFSSEATGAKEKALSTRWHLLALVLNQSGSGAVVLLNGTAEALLDVLLPLLQLHSEVYANLQRMPQWLSPALLAAEATLTSARGFSDINIPKEDEAIPDHQLMTGPDFTRAYDDLFPLCLQLLSLPELPRDELIATLRLLVILTRERRFAEEFLAKGGLPSLIERFQRPTQDHIGCQIYLVLILRHLVEDEAVLKEAMKDALVDWFHQPRSRVVEVPSFLRNVYMVALRDAKVFLETTTSVCQLVSDQPAGGTYHIGLRPNIKTKAIAPDAPHSESNEADGKLDEAEKHIPSSTSLDAVVHYLVGELLRVGKVSIGGPLSDKPVETAEAVRTGIDAVTGPDGESAAAAAPSDADPPEHVYLCQLMAWLTELLTSYSACKVAFINHAKKRSGKEPVGTPAKHRLPILNFLIQDLLFAGSLGPRSTADRPYHRRTEVGVWSMSVLTALCRDEFSPRDGKELSGDLVAVRKSVLDAIAKAIKDLSTTDSHESKYDKLHAIADLCHHLLTARSGAPSKTLDDASLHMAKLMLEKNFVSLLTSTLAEVDLNYPHVKTLVNAILRPLEQLTKVAIKMGRATDKDKELDNVLDSPVLAAIDHRGGAGREETPDLYRNSALGMFGGEMDEMAYEPEGQEEDEEEGEDEEMEVEFEDEDTDGTDIDTEEEEQAAGEEIDAGTADSHDAWEDEEEEEDEDENGEEMEGEGEEHSETSEDEEEEEEGEGIMWEENPEAVGNPEDGSGDEGDDDIHIPVQLMGDEGLQDEDDEGSDMGDMHADIGILEPHFAVPPAEGGVDRVPGGGWRLPFQAVHGGPGEGHEHPMGLFFPPLRRSRLGDPAEADFGMPRARNAVDHITVPHPLLVDPSVARGPSTASARHSHRRGVRSLGIHEGRGAQEFLATMENLDEAFQLLGQLLGRARAGGEGIELEVAGVPLSAIGGAAREGIRQLSARRGLGAHPAALPSHRPDRMQHSVLDGDDFGATSTIHRWQEEAAISQGQSSSDKALKLGNHLVLALLPSAREAAAAAKLEDEKQAKELAEAEAKATAEAKAAEDVAIAASSAESSHDRSESILSEDARAVENAESEPLVPAPVPEEDIEMASEPEVQEEPTVAEGGEVSSGTESVDNAGAVQGTDASSTHETEGAVAGPSNANARVTVLVHGEPVDITDTGIDPTFLEALPDDMREEVLNQHFRERRPTTREEVPQGSAISAEFLDALPADIRAEILLQEGAEQRRLARESAAAGAQPASGPVDMDPASFLASLDPQLRSVVLLEQEDGFLQTLPSSLIAEANDLRAIAQRRLPFAARAADPRGGQRASGAMLGEPSSSQRKPLRDAIQLLDKSGIATLVRLLFFPQLLRKNYLHKILVNISENGKTRAELINLLLNILQDGSGDLAAVDKAFAQLSLRPPKPPQLTPKSTPKQPKPLPESPLVQFHALPPIPGENVPNLIAQRSIEALTFVVNANEQAAIFFLTEQDAPLGLKRTASKKGKGKEKQSSSTKFPIVVLLGLLDRPTLLSTASLMDSVAALLSTVTRPLSSLGASKPGPDASVSTAAPAPAAPVALASESSNVAGALAGTDVAQIQVQGSSEVSTGAPVASSAAALPVVPPADKPQGDSQSSPLLTQPPQVPHHVLRLIVNILTVGECSSKTFQQTLALISHLSYLPDARDVIASELKGRAQGLGSSLFKDLDQLATVLEDPTTSDDARNANVTKFSPASSDQAKLLRILKTIDYMFLPKKPPGPSQAPAAVEPVGPVAAAAASTGAAADASSNPSPEAADAEKVYAIYEGFRFTPLWRRLGDCLAIVEEKPELEHVATMLLPLIESLMVVCKYVAPRSGADASARLLRSSSSPRSPTTPRESMEDLFVTFTDAHRKMLNVMVRNNPSLMSGSFSLLVQNARVLDFDNKRNYFNQQLHKRPHNREHHQTLQLNIRRAHVFEDSFQHLQRKSGEQIKYGKLSIRFYDEEGVDAGGVTREWFQILARQMFNPDYALFEPCAADKLTYQPNHASWINPEHLLFFKFVGRIIGKAIYDGRLLDAHFARSFYRQLLGKPVDYKDVEWVDPAYYNSLTWILEHDPSDLDLSFTVDASEFGTMKSVPLVPGGEKIPVTNENKREYVQMAAHHRLVSSMKDQIEHLLLGFFEIIPKDLITIFNEQEVELLISGTPEINVDEWRAATEYNGYVSSDPVIVWWWRALKSFSREERAKTLSFVSGTSRVPLDGFNALQGVQGVQRFSIHKAYGDPDRLPQAHTCFNQIDLPQYTSYDKLRTQLLLAINEGGEGFGFA